MECFELAVPAIFLSYAPTYIRIMVMTRVAEVTVGGGIDELMIISCCYAEYFHKI